MKTTWVAAVFGLLVGTAMVFVPYEFGATVYRHIYAYTRGLGAVFLSGSLLLVISSLYPRWPRAIDLTGRALFLAAAGVYWWGVNVLAGGVTGAVVYPLLMAALLVEALPGRARVRHTFIPYVGLTAVGLGVVMTSVPHAFSADVYGALSSMVRGLGVLFVGLGALLLHAAWTGSDRRVRLTAALLVAPFALLSVMLFLMRGWAGGQLHATLAGALVIFLVRARLKIVPSIRWRLWRGMVLSACLPLLALGALASVLMQRAIEAQALEEAGIAVASEVEWLTELHRAQLEALRAHSELPSFREAVRERNREVLDLSAQVLGFHSAPLESVYVTDERGEVLARTDPRIPITASVAGRDFFTRTRAEGSYTSTPYVGDDGRSRLVLAVAVRDPAGFAGALVGTLSVAELSGRASSSSASYAIRVVDRRDGALLRSSGAVRSEWMPETVRASLATAGRGTYLGADEDGRQVLVTWAHVPGTEWLVMARQEVAEAFALVTRLGMGAMVLVTGAALLALLLSQLVAHEVTRRMRRVREAAEALARGEMHRRVDPEGNDELAHLAASFNQMADQLQAGRAALEQINADLQSAVQVRDEFLSMASHELRTPLTPLKATAHTLRRLLTRGDGELERPRLLSMLDRVDRQTDRLALLVGDMLDISRIQAGRFSLAPEPTNLSALVSEVVERVRSVSQENAERLRCELPDAAVEGLWDGARLEQVVVNLVENALRYSPQGGPIQVALRESGEQVVLTVSDRGIGIPRDNLEQLFEPFFRAANAAARHYGGLGLGLHICREIVERHGGKIWAESDGPEQGSRFHVELPRRAAAAEERAA